MSGANIPRVPTYAPLGGGTQRPRPQDRLREINAAQADYERKLQEAGALYDDLCAHPSLIKIWEELNKQLLVMLAENPFCRAFLQIIQGYKTTLDAPKLAEARLRMIMGPVLMEAMSKEPADAP